MDKVGKTIKVIKYTLITSTIIGIIISIAVGGIFTKWVMEVIKDTEELNVSNMYNLLEETSYVYTSEGELLEQVESSIHRIMVDYQSIPKHTIDAFVAIEDERFWEHIGIDPKRLLGVIWLNYKTGSRQGASTISQQLAKNIYLSPEQTYERKIKDIYYAIQLEKQLTKQQILEGYLNTVYFGRGAYGIKAASETYFNKDVKDLTIEESVLLAGIPQKPSKYSLVNDPPLSTVGA